MTQFLDERTVAKANKEQMDPWGLFQYWSKSVFHPLHPVFPAAQGCLISTPRLITLLGRASDFRPYCI